MHHELAITTRTTKEILEVCKRATKASEQMHTNWSTIKNTNEELSTQQTEAKLKEVEERLQTSDSYGTPHAPD